MLSQYEQVVKSIYETAGAGITNLVAIIDGMKDKIAKLTKTIERLNSELTVYRDKSMARKNAAGTKIVKMTRAEYRRRVAAYEAQKNGREPDEDSKKSGGQPVHKGTLRKGTVSGTVRFSSQLCSGCGRADMDICIACKIVIDLSDQRQETEQKMYVIEKGLCCACLTKTLPHTGAIPGTSFGPRLRAHIHTYKDGHATEGGRGHTEIHRGVGGLVALRGRYPRAYRPLQNTSTVLTDVV